MRNFSLYGKYVVDRVTLAQAIVADADAQADDDTIPIEIRDGRGGVVQRRLRALTAYPEPSP